MKVVLVSIDNKESYEDNLVLPVVVCANMQKALEYIDSHPITPDVFKSVFHYPMTWAKDAQYTLEFIEVYQ